jgi:hypothetical protein
VAISDEWTEWHLTPAGWVRGTQAVAGLHPRQPPMDRVLTVLWRENVTSNQSEIDNEAEELWRTTNQKLLEKLLGEFGNVPRHL